jgi:hypothetical protein
MLVRQRRRGRSGWYVSGPLAAADCNGGSNSGVQDYNGNLGAGIIVLIVFLSLLFVALPIVLAIAYFACGCKICGRSRAGKVLAETQAPASPAQGVVV